MKADVAFPALLAAARALKPYTTPVSPYLAHQWGLRLHTRGDTLTLSTSNGPETAQVDLPGGTSDSAGCALAADTLITALTAIKPAGKTAKTATVTLASEEDRLYLAVTGGQAIMLDTDIDAPPQRPATVQPTEAARFVTAGTAADWCDLVGKVGWAASRDKAYPDLQVVRLLRDSARTMLMVEAGDRYRIHRGGWAQPDGQPVDARIPIAAAERAVKLFTTCDPDGKVCVDVDDEHIWWRTDQVRLQARTGHEPSVNLEQIRENVCETVNVRFTAGRADLLAALDTAAALAATTRRRRINIESTGADATAVDISVYADSGALLHRAPVPATAPAGPAQALTFNPRFARQVVAFLDRDTVQVAATAGLLGVYLESGTRHAILMQLAA